MLRQTQAVRVVPAFTRFVNRFPTIEVLAAAPVSDVVREWSGLGYNRRAVSLAHAARLVVREFGGVVPDDPHVLTRLSGVGPYTAAAVASIAYSVPVPAIDTNVRRVVARVRLGANPQGVAAIEIDRAARRWLDRDDPGRWNQALMDLGRVTCRPVPRCSRCPLASACSSRARGVPPRTLDVRRSSFEGSFRQVRGAVVEALRAVPAATLGSLSRRIGLPAERVGQAVRALAKDGVVRAGPAALAGRSRGRISLPA